MAVFCAALTSEASASAATETVLHAFSGGADGGNPYASLIADTAGNLYGTTYHGGNSYLVVGDNSYGVVFKLSPNGAETVLHSFTGFPDDGSYPSAALIADNAGNLYGTTSGGGVSNQGVVFKLAPNGTEDRKSVV